MKKRLQKKFFDLYHQEVSLLEEEYSDRWDFENAVAEINHYLGKTAGIGRKIRLLREAIWWDSKRLSGGRSKENYLVLDVSLGGINQPS